MTLNSLEVTKCCKNRFILFLLLCDQIFLIFTFFIFRIIFGRTCYGTTVVATLFNLNYPIAGRLHLHLVQPTKPTQHTSKSYPKSHPQLAEQSYPNPYPQKRRILNYTTLAPTNDSV